MRLPLRRRHAIAAGATLLVALAGCAWRAATVPLRTIADRVDRADSSRPAKTLLVLLPGSYSAPEEFLREGFVQTVREHRLAADVLLVDAHVGYYQGRSIVERLRADVIAPARARGVERIWLAGISIGAVGAMLYADAHPDDIDGIVLLGPYLGQRMTALDIRQAGGLAAWPAPAPSPDNELDATLWRWLQRQTGPSGSGRKIPLLLGYGLDDRYAYNDAVLADAMPASSVFTAPGGHDWSAWRPLWRAIVDTLPIAREVAASVRRRGIDQAALPGGRKS